MAKLVQPTSDWAPDYVKTREECGGEEQCPAFPRDIIRNQTDLTYVDVDCASTRGHQDFPASTRGEAAAVRRLLLILCPCCRVLQLEGVRQQQPRAGE